MAAPFFDVLLRFKNLFTNLDFGGSKASMVYNTIDFVGTLLDLEPTNKANKQQRRITVLVSAFA